MTESTHSDQKAQELPKTYEQVREELRAAVLLLLLAIERAKQEHPGCTIKLMIAAEKPDGSGHIAARLDHADFINDVARLVGCEEPSVGDKAAFFLASHGLSVAKN